MRGKSPESLDFTGRKEITEWCPNPIFWRGNQKGNHDIKLAHNDRKNIVLSVRFLEEYHMNFYAGTLRK